MMMMIHTGNWILGWLSRFHGSSFNPVHLKQGHTPSRIPSTKLNYVNLKSSFKGISARFRTGSEPVATYLGLPFPSSNLRLSAGVDVRSVVCSVGGAAGVTASIGQWTEEVTGPYWVTLDELKESDVSSVMLTLLNSSQAFLGTGARQK